ncbi:LPXTG cell wall anchor domain-containing protein [Parascardovia denticolens]|uniref:LPXTG cell wall anchor domain-containing protein n=1 Tax=Parascardovia denticolens TaxID=78258 RepID=UPI00248DDF5A|nr:LPXTG cell wall anchor domain-containing protein [Parascardovia denticolens]
MKPAAVKPAPKKELARTGVSILPLAGVALAVLVLAGVALAFRRKQKPENK